MGTALHATCLGAGRPPCDAYRFMPIFRSVGDPWNFTLSLPAISRYRSSLSTPLALTEARPAGSPFSH